MKNTNYESLVKSLQNLAGEWAAQFDRKPPLDLHFHVTTGSFLTVNGIALGAAEGIKGDAATYDEEFLYIPLTDGSEYEIYLEWTNENICRIGHIKHIRTVYCTESIMAG